MARTEHTSRNPLLSWRRELHQSQGIADLRSTAPNPACQLLVGASEVIQQLLIGVRLFKRVQLASVQIFQERIAQHVVVVGLAHDGRDRLHTGLLGGAHGACSTARDEEGP